MRLSIVVALCLLPAVAAAQQEGPAAPLPPGGEGPAPPAPADLGEPEAPGGDAELAPESPESTISAPVDLGAPPIPPAAGPHLRKGLFAGATLGIGGLTADCNGCADYDALGFSLDAGWALNEKWGVVAELWFSGGLDSEDSDRGGQMVELGLAARFWPVERLWVQAGLGAGFFSLVQEGLSDPLRKASGTGLVLGAGVELWRSPTRHVVVDLRARLGFYAVEQDSGGGSDSDYDVTQKGVLAGISWY